MAQHFLLSAKARQMSFENITLLSDKEIFQLLKTARWGNPESINTVTCPRCKVEHKAYFRRGRQTWQCKHCRYIFSIIAGSIFHNSNLPLRTLLYMLWQFSNNAKGISAIKLSHEVNVQYKTAWIWLQKFREVIQQHHDVSPLENEVHIDGCYVNHYIRPKNFKHRRIDRRKKRNQRADKACVMVFRQKAANQENIKGADRSIVALVKEENAQDVKELTYKLVKSKTKICADENPAYDNLALHYDLWRVNHSQEYCSVEGVTNNLAESFFARFRRMIMGVHHRMDNKYMMRYACEIAWREDTRRQSNKERFDTLLGKCLNTKPSRDLTGYWQGNKKGDARFGVASIDFNASNDVIYKKAA